MPVRFVIGRAGTGKTRRAFDAIRDRCAHDPLGAPVYWVLPKQATFTAERELTCLSGLAAITRARVLSFEQLGRDVLEECGGVAIPQVTAIGRRMVLGHLLRQRRGELQFFKSVAHQTGLAAELDATFAEFERRGRGASDLSALVTALQDANSGESDRALAAKLHDLHVLYVAYGDYLGQERLDPHRRLQQVLTCVETSGRMRGAAFYVDGFYVFTDYERRFLASVAKVAGVIEINLTLDPASPTLRDPHHLPDELGMFHPIEDTYRRLYFAFTEAGVEVEPEPVLMKRAARFRNTTIAHVESHLLAPSPQGHDDHKPDDSKCVEFIEAPDRRAEVDAAARRAQALVAGGMRLRDIAVLVRDLDAYHELIDASFREHGLPWFVDRRRSAAHHPLVQFARSLPALAMHPWDHDTMLTVLKSGLVPLVTGSVDPSQIDAANLDAGDRLENYVVEHRIRGDAWSDEQPWTYRRELLAQSSDGDTSGAEDGVSLIARDQVEAMDRLRRRLVQPLLSFLAPKPSSSPGPHGSSTARPLRELVSSLFQVFENCGVRATLTRWIEQADTSPERLQQRAEHAQVWNDLSDLLDQMVDLLGEEAVSSRDFAEILETGLETFDLALTPPTVDQILVGSVDRTRTPPGLRATIILGLHEGGFPRCPSENSILCDDERDRLRSRDMDIDPGSTRRLFNERFFFYIACTRAAEHLCAMRPLADDDGRPLAPSQFWNALRGLDPGVPVQSVARDASRTIDCVGTPRQLITGLLRWARDDEQANETLSGAASKGWPALYDMLALHQCDDGRLDMVRYRAWRALAYTNDARLSPDVSKKLFRDPLNASVSRIETFATCPFKHFARYGLKLQPREAADVTALDLGNVYHGILERVVRKLVEDRKDFKSASVAYTQEQIQTISSKVGQSLRGELMLSNARNQYMLRHVEKTLGRVMRAARAAALRGEFSPWKTELAFGVGDVSGESSLPALELKTPVGRTVRLHGKIDRVDLLEQQAAVAVVDYKLSGNSLNLDRVEHGLSLQLLTYLIVLQASGNKLGHESLTPAAAFYVQLLRKLESVKHPNEATNPADDKFHLRVQPRGLVDESFISTFDDKLTGGQSEVINVFVKQDGEQGARSDAIGHEAFAALLNLVERKLGALADQIMDGEIAVSPYRIGTITPCPQCDFRSVCRFEPARQRYRDLHLLGRIEVLKQAMELNSDRGERDRTTHASTPAKGTKRGGK